MGLLVFAHPGGTRTGSNVQERKSDYTFHPPSGSSVPGKEDANPFMNYPPEEIRRLLKDNKADPEERRKMKSALKQWERQYVYPYYPFRKKQAARVAAMFVQAEIVGPAQNLNYYQDMEVPEGIEGILDSNKSVHDQENAERFDYNRQGERPCPEMDFLDGDFLAPRYPVFNEGRGVVSPRGDGPEPEGMETPFPPTGGPIEAWPDMI